MPDDNIIKFQRPKQKKPPRSMSPGIRKAAIWLAIIAGIVAIWAYQQFIVYSG